MTGNCLCGAVTVTIDAKPDYIHDCNCSLCRKAGAAWGYYTIATARTAGATDTFVRKDKDTPSVEIHFCRDCGATTHYQPTRKFRTEGSDTFGVNMRLFDPDVLMGVEVRYPDGKQWPGSGPFGYRRAPRSISRNTRW